MEYLTSIMIMVNRSGVGKEIVRALVASSRQTAHTDTQIPVTTHIHTALTFNSFNRRLTVSSLLSYQ